jgi:hypothetical protein
MPSTARYQRSAWRIRANTCSPLPSCPLPLRPSSCSQIRTTRQPRLRSLRFATFQPPYRQPASSQHPRLPEVVLRSHDFILPFRSACGSGFASHVSRTRLQPRLGCLTTKSPRHEACRATVPVAVLSRQRLQNLIPRDVLVTGDGLEDGVECADAQTPMRRHSDAVVRGLFCLQHNVAAFLMDLPVTPIAAQNFDQLIPFPLRSRGTFIRRRALRRERDAGECWLAWVCRRSKRQLLP